MGLSEIINNITDKEIEEVYDAIRGTVPHEHGVAILEKIKANMYTFRSQFLAMNEDPFTHRNFVSLYKKLEGQIFELERYIRLKEDNIAFMPQEQALKIVSNVHLLLNSFRSLGSDVDKRK